MHTGGIGVESKYYTAISPDMVWPSCNESIRDIAWTLRHAPDTLKRSDKLIAASVIEAYLQMVGDTQKKRNAVCKALSKSKEA